ncbi:hypothetical protein TNCT_169771, partial [Trichonephila clavata]
MPEISTADVERLRRFTIVGTEHYSDGHVSVSTKL